MASQLNKHEESNDEFSGDKVNAVYPCICKLGIANHRTIVS
jgi:hypothetical protein